MIKPIVHDFEATELFAAMIGKPEPETDAEISALDGECIDRFGIDLTQFTEIVSHLLPLCEHQILGLTGLGPVASPRTAPSCARSTTWILLQGPQLQSSLTLPLNSDDSP